MAKGSKNKFKVGDEVETIDSEWLVDAGERGRIIKIDKTDSNYGDNLNLLINNVHGLFWASSHNVKLVKPAPKKAKKVTKKETFNLSFWEVLLLLAFSSATGFAIAHL